jgi:nitric oxide synthase oxygenase domain/subunit
MGVYDVVSCRVKGQEFEDEQTKDFWCPQLIRYEINEEGRLLQPSFNDLDQHIGWEPFDFSGAVSFDGLERMITFFDGVVVNFYDFAKRECVRLQEIK